MGSLREHGIVSSEDGKNGGWRLRKELRDLTVLDVQRALQNGPLLTKPPFQDHPDDGIETSAYRVVAAAYEAAESELKDAFEAVRLSDIALDSVRQSEPRRGITSR